MTSYNAPEGRDEFKIAILCALPKERDAVLASQYDDPMRNNAGIDQSSYEKILSARG